ncbi:MAG: RNA polymerase sigma-70 factor (ECF subfamily) [Alphaproteobacteria bacterium]|jgi:RNA polymerase sigma-70 factor (ECF subfamily)
MLSFLPSILMPSTQSKTPPEEVMADYIMNRDKKAIMALYSEFSDDLYHYLLTLSDHTLAKDIVQKTWLKVIEKPHSYHTTGSVKAWLFTMARNALIDEFRKTNRWVALDDTDVIKDAAITKEIHYDTSQYADTKHNIDTDNLQSSFDQALMALSFEQREAFCLRQEGFSLAEIAHMTHSKQETIKTRLRYAKTKLKEWLEQAHD